MSEAKKKEEAEKAKAEAEKKAKAEAEKKAKAEAEKKAKAEAEKKAKAEADRAKPPPKHQVAEGKALTSRRGILSSGDPCHPGDFSSDAEADEALVDKLVGKGLLVDFKPPKAEDESSDEK
jgi:membrane protein involved in colicin uptake